MSEEQQEQKHEMYVQQIEWETFISVMEKVTNVNKVYMYNMPNKAEKYVDDIVGLIHTLDGYLRGDDEWRVTNDANVQFGITEEKDMVCVGNWSFGKPKLLLCIPKLNSFFIVPDSDALYKGSSSPTTIIQLSNCISVMPMLLTMREVPNPEKEGSYNIAMSYEMVNRCPK